MDPDPHSKLSATNAIATLRSNFRTSTQALKTLEQYLRHLENLLLEELGREEFERRLECLILRDQRDGESLFIPEDTLISRKRRGSSSTEMGSEMKKKVRVDSAVSDLGRSIFDGGGRLHSDSPDLSPKSARNTPVPWELPAVDAQQTRTTTTAVKQTARHPIVAPRSRPPRGSQSVMLPNKQPSSNFHSGSQSTLLLNLHPSPDFNSGSSSPLKRGSSMSTVYSTTKQSSPASSRRDSVQSDKAASKQSHSGSLSSIRNSPLPGPKSSNSARHSTAHALPKRPVVPSAPGSSSSIKQPPSLKSKSSSSSSSDRSALSSRQGLSLANKSTFGSSRLALSSEQQQQQPLSLTRKPWRASKK
ncbi:uncharacterized protein M437DRAFT_88523 [Aureobasidium melanogenum CBS 110374]|uniref:Uncharacterized protein n=1 Tax=Aureobasidium melanogenum (strain CBS 110374) TaxID=1043003 RepID=A0A074VLL3_AURM1|nr:uncharacterized protein M437DRAFT_88523 [Aureobasidium melanogenum CBS 110374]KEQ58557.1 hypothetical protein M437DRAFT_88523 [Aureobasidium melanogenum CBS 110374]